MSTMEAGRVARSIGKCQPVINGLLRIGAQVCSGFLWVRRRSAIESGVKLPHSKAAPDGLSMRDVKEQADDWPRWKWSGAERVLCVEKAAWSGRLMGRGA